MNALQLAWGSAACLCLLYIAVGIVDLVWVERHQRREERLRTVLAERVTGGSDPTEVDRELSRRWIARNPVMLQSFSQVLSGESVRQLRVDAERAGATKRVRRLAARRSWRLRAQAAGLLRLLPSDDPIVAALLTDRRYEVRARALDSIDADALAAHVDVVIQACDADDDATRFAAQQAIVGGDDRMVDALIAAIGAAAKDQSRPEGVRTILGAAAGARDPRVAAVVASHDWGGDVEQRLHVVAILATGFEELAERRLMAMANDDEAAVRAAALRAIGRLGDPRNVSMIGRHLRDESWEARQAAGAALVRLGPSGLLTLRRYTDDADNFASDMAREILHRNSLGPRWVE